MSAMVLCAASCKNKAENAEGKRLARVYDPQTEEAEQNYWGFYWTGNRLDSISVFLLDPGQGICNETFVYDENGHIVSSAYAGHNTEYTYDGDKIVKIFSKLSNEMFACFNVTYEFEYQGDRISRVLRTLETAIIGEEPTSNAMYTAYTWEGDKLVKEESGIVENGVMGPINYVQYNTYDDNHNPYYKEGFMDFVNMFYPVPPFVNAYICSHNLLSVTSVKVDSTGATTDTAFASTFSYTYDEDGYPITGKCIHRNMMADSTVSYNLAFEYVK